LKRLYRAVFYLIGVLILAVGITLNTKTGLGVSPIVSVTFSTSRIFAWNFGVVNFCQYTVFILCEILLRKKATIAEFLQLPFSFVFSFLLDFCSGLITYDSTLHGMGANLVLLAAAIVLTGIGISLSVNMLLVPNPGDGIVFALAERMGWEQGFAKNIFDVCCVLTTCGLGLLFAGEIIGIGLGTLATMIGVGRAVALVNRLCKETMLRLAGLSDPDGEKANTKEGRIR